MIVVHGRSTPPCPFCVQAKKMLEAANIDFTYKDLSADEWSIKEQEEKYGTSIRTVPFITFNETVIGGSSELAKWLREVRA